MGASQVVFNEQTLSGVASAIASYQGKMKQALEEALTKVKSLEPNWNDEDYEALLQGFAALKEDSSDLEVGVVQLVARIRQKLEAIAELHSLEI